MKIDKKKLSPFFKKTTLKGFEENMRINKFLHAMNPTKTKTFILTPESPYTVVRFKLEENSLKTPAELKGTTQPVFTAAAHITNATGDLDFLVAENSSTSLTYATSVLNGVDLVNTRQKLGSLSNIEKFLSDGNNRLSIMQCPFPINGLNYLAVALSTRSHPFRVSQLEKGNMLIPFMLDGSESVMTVLHETDAHMDQILNYMKENPDCTMASDTDIWSKEAKETNQSIRVNSKLAKGGKLSVNTKQLPEEGVVLPQGIILDKKSVELALDSDESIVPDLTVDGGESIVPDLEVTTSEYSFEKEIVQPEPTNVAPFDAQSEQNPFENPNGAPLDAQSEQNPFENPNGAPFDAQTTIDPLKQQEQDGGQEM